MSNMADTICQVSDSRQKEIIKMIGRGQFDIRKATSEVLSDIHIMSEYAAKHPTYYDNLPQHMKMDKQLSMRVLRSCPGIMRLIPEDLSHDEVFCLSLLRQRINVVKFLPLYVLSCKEIAMEACSVSSDGLKYIHPQFLQQYDVIHHAVRCWGSALQHAPIEYRKMLVIAKSAIENDGMAIQYVDYSLLCKYRELSTIAIRQNGCAIEFCPDYYKSDRHYVSIAVSQNGSAITKVDAQFLDDKDIALIALKTRKELYGKLSKRLQKDSEIIKALGGSYDDELTKSAIRL